MPGDDMRECWKEQDYERLSYDAERIAALAGSREKLNSVVRWGAMIVTSALAAGFLYNVWSVNQPWIRFGQAWAFGWLAFIAGTELRRTDRRRVVNEPGIRFLQMQHEQRAEGYLRIRGRLWVLLPSIVTAWLGRRAAPWPYIVVLVVLGLVWLAFGEAARKARRDAHEFAAYD